MDGNNVAEVEAGLMKEVFII